MKILITGISGTVAPKAAAAFERHGAEIVAWNRNAVSPDDADATTRFIDETRPDAICHLALGSEEWAARLAGESARRQIKILFVSTAMVFGSKPNGPHRPGDVRTADEDYGRYKIRSEDSVRRENPNSIIARFGWQIDPDATGNNMLRHLDDQQRNNGKIGASRLWIPACSFIADTAEGLWDLLSDGTPGTYHLDSNAEDAWSFDRIAHALKAKFARMDWKIEVNESYVHDQRLLDEQPRIARLSETLERS
jgi:dTDP-4-dehydrorhamnose reductase